MNSGADLLHLFLIFCHGDELQELRNSSCRETIYLGKDQLQVKGEKDEAKPKWLYDADEYSQNFDEGTGWAEPDNLSRSFSARFADPSRILIKNSSVRCVRGV
ncbi:hypothetical protein GH714_035619 [Hevea brasiliensis]|uniref:Uncharacterized protein n=1 Tax=Hevea brasiliensis TaxID=3981 RepID=A0A6A6KDD4_HEVBR|nr:hypothetical protein GH714_035619 [Hevea brasiliensis]